ncbi:MAG TPA: gas vesicle protein GvpJ [Jiangellaceae bacterium]|nr:gas vesicle protein GvpJ [Jiangellaceae bacterium]
MTVMTQASGGGRSGSLYDVIELILDRGLVIDAFVRVSLLGIEVLTVEARVVVASVDTYLRFAETASRLQLTASSDTKSLPELVEAIADDGTKNGSKLVQGRKEGSR